MHCAVRRVKVNHFKGARLNVLVQTDSGLNWFYIVFYQKKTFPLNATF